MPENTELGRIAYLCLLPVILLPMDLILGSQSTTINVVTLLALVVFLPLFFLVFWLRGPRAIWPLAGMVLLGVLVTPYNTNASLFFIYASGLIGYINRTDWALRSLIVIIAAVALESWWFGLSVGFWAPTIIFVIMLGGFCIHWSETNRINARLRVKQEEIERLAKVAERERIARDLHDLLGHTLSLNVLKARLAARLIRKDPDQAYTEVSDIEQISRDALKEVRHAVQGYRSTDLASEVSNARLALEAAGIEGSFNVDQISVDESRNNTLAMTLREAVTNVIRHSRARTCHIELVQEDSCVGLTVTDDGQGGQHREGSGILGMRARISDLNGSIRIDGSNGTILRISIPAAQTAVAHD